MTGCEKDEAVKLRVTLKRERCVCVEDRGCVVCVEMGPAVQKRYVPQGNLDALTAAFGGTTRSVRDVLAEAPNLRGLTFLFPYGYKLRYEIQDNLIALVATGRASIMKEGARYLYRINLAG